MTNNYLIRTRNTVIAMIALLSTAVHAQDTTVQELTDKWSSAYNTFDNEALSNLYTENAHLYTDELPMLVGREEIEAFWSNDFTVDNPKTVLSVTQSVVGYDMIFVQGDYQVLSNETDLVLSSGEFGHIWHKVDGDWKINQDIWTQPKSDES